MNRMKTMNSKLRPASALVITVLLSGFVLGQNSISASQAKNHVGENATVCGQVATTHYADRSRGNPTFINLDKPYPNQVFTILIWGSDRPKFGNPEDDYRGKHVCVTGNISMYRGDPEVVARDPAQISVK